MKHITVANANVSEPREQPASRYTPGPWNRNIKPIRKYPVIFAGRNTHISIVCTSYGMPEDEAEANANLIAAAPELMVALKNLVSSLTIADSITDEAYAARAILAKVQSR